MALYVASRNMCVLGSPVLPALYAGGSSSARIESNAHMLMMYPTLLYKLIFKLMNSFLLSPCLRQSNLTLIIN